MLIIFLTILNLMNEKASREYLMPYLNKGRIAEHVSSVEAKIIGEVNTLEINLGFILLLEQVDKNLIQIQTNLRTLNQRSVSILNK